MKIIASFLLVLSMVATSCSRKSNPTTGATADYLITGYTGGFAGPIAMQPYYLIKDNQLKKATMGAGNVPDDVSKFNFDVAMPASQYELVKDLPKSIPAELLAHPDKSFGSTPGADMGYLDVRASVNGKTYRWDFQPDLSGTSVEVRDFVNKIGVLYK